MSNTALTQLQEGLTTAYIDGTAAANLAYKPAFVSNNPEEGKKVICGGTSANVASRVL